MNNDILIGLLENLGIQNDIKESAAKYLINCYITILWSIYKHSFTDVKSKVCKLTKAHIFYGTCKFEQQFDYTFDNNTDRLLALDAFNKLLTNTLNEYRSIAPKSKICSLNKEGLSALQLGTDNAFKNLLQIIPTDFCEPISIKIARHAWSIFSLCKSTYKYPFKRKSVARHSRNYKDSATETDPNDDEDTNPDKEHTQEPLYDEIVKLKADIRALQSENVAANTERNMYKEMYNILKNQVSNDVDKDDRVLGEDTFMPDVQTFDSDTQTKLSGDDIDDMNLEITSLKLKILNERDNHKRKIMDIEMDYLTKILQKIKERDTLQAQIDAQEERIASQQLDIESEVAHRDFSLMKQHQKLVAEGNAVINDLKAQLAAFRHKTASKTPTRIPLQTRIRKPPPVKKLVRQADRIRAILRRKNNPTNYSSGLCFSVLTENNLLKPGDTLETFANRTKAWGSSASSSNDSSKRTALQKCIEYALNHFNQLLPMLESDEGLGSRGHVNNLNDSKEPGEIESDTVPVEKSPSKRKPYGKPLTAACQQAQLKKRKSPGPLPLQNKRTDINVVMASKEALPEDLQTENLGTTEDIMTQVPDPIEDTQTQLQSTKYIMEIFPRPPKNRVSLRKNKGIPAPKYGEYYDHSPIRRTPTFKKKRHGMNPY